MSFVIKNVYPGNLNALVKNLMTQMGIDDPNEAVRLINSGKWVVKQVDLSGFSTWKTVVVGNLSNAKTARKRLKDVGVKITDWGSDILERVTFGNTEAPLDLVQVSVEELGLKIGGTAAEIFAAAGRHGLSLCPAEVAPQSWLQHPDLLPRGKWLLVAMEAIVDSASDPLGLCLGHTDKDCLLDVYDGRPGCRWSADRTWIFRRCK
jgi:hypothetical protein